MSDDNGTASDRLIARFPGPASERGTDIALVGDPHVTEYVESETERLVSAEEYLRRTVADIDERDVDGVACIGDIANGLDSEYERVDAVLERLAVEFVAVPGNHDVPDTTPPGDGVLPRAEFEERYAKCGLPFVHRVGDVELVGLDSVRLREALRADGTATQIEWLGDRLPELTRPVVMTHHPLPGMTGWLERYESRIEGAETPDLWEDPEPLVDVLEAHDVPLVLSGHLHLLGVASTRGLREIMAPQLPSFPQGYVVLEIGAGGTDAFFRPIADHEETEADFLRRFGGVAQNRVRASATAAFLAGPPVDMR